MRIWDQRGQTLTNPVIASGNNFIVIRLKCEVTAQGVRGFNPDAPRIPIKDGGSLSEKIQELRTLLEAREIDKETFENIKQKLLDDYLS